MNQFSQQPVNFQGQQSILNGNRDQHDSSGYVQSHYQGQLSAPTFNGGQSQSIVNNSSSGYQHSNAGQYGGITQHSPSYHSISQPAVSNHSFTTHHPAPSYSQQGSASYTNTAPAISHVGYQAGQNYSHNQSQGQGNSHSQDHYQGQQHGYSQSQNQNNYVQHSLYQPSTGNNSSQHQSYQAAEPRGYQSNSASHSYGTGQAHSNTPLNPVYQATNAYEQAGPVISRYGWQSTSSNNSNNFGGTR
ncbi:hypothetical protein [Paenibacillus sp. L3-i20]|uniref:hypothetical protein n=1 Tax=Paenibacillus sp. L3-i20 TaxID=2905833 RepID=UPI001EDD1728|nr:hypothetical protein [Paenibacillus sp. L3-i20]GKU78456.1 hypothetical protein L3i20_v228530 [Paenibacillus sp. L3-i20]